MSQTVPAAGIAQGDRRNAFGRPSLTPADTPSGPRLRCTTCRALACPDCAGCHCTSRPCSHVPHRCCGGGNPE